MAGRCGEMFALIPRPKVLLRQSDVDLLRAHELLHDDQLTQAWAYIWSHSDAIEQATQQR